MLENVLLVQSFLEVQTQSL